MGNKYFVKNIGLINVHGKDFIDFMNRMSTNDFRKFPPDEFRKTILTSDKGRIVDFVNILNDTVKQIILTSNNFQEKIKAHLDKYIILDDVQLNIPLEKYIHIIIMQTPEDDNGINQIESAKKLFNIDIEKNKIYKINDESTNEADFLFYDDFRLETLNIICRENNFDNYKNILSHANVFENGFEKINCEEYEYLRIKAALPEGENELNDQINPMECGLDRYISFNKGCYIGQEVIARLDSQGKRPKQMIKIKSNSEISKGDKIFLDNKEVGFVSSSIIHEGSCPGLGFIRSINLDFEQQYSAEHNNEKFKIDISPVEVSTEK